MADLDNLGADGEPQRLNIRSAPLYKVTGFRLVMVPYGKALQMVIQAVLQVPRNPIGGRCSKLALEKVKTTRQHRQADHQQRRQPEVLSQPAALDKLPEYPGDPTGVVGISKRKVNRAARHKRDKVAQGGRAQHGHNGEDKSFAVTLHQAPCHLDCLPCGVSWTGRGFNHEANQPRTSVETGNFQRCQTYVSTCCRCWSNSNACDEDNLDPLINHDSHCEYPRIRTTCSLWHLKGQEQ